MEENAVAVGLIMEAFGVSEQVVPSAVLVNKAHATEGVCKCCEIDPSGNPSDPDNLICSAKGYLGTLRHDQINDVCKVIETERDGRCSRAREIRRGARDCRDEYPDDHAKFLECFVGKWREKAS